MQLKKIAGYITCDSHFALRSQKKKGKKAPSLLQTAISWPFSALASILTWMNYYWLTMWMTNIISLWSHTVTVSLIFGWQVLERSLIKVKQCILMCRNFPFFCSKVKHLFHLVSAVMLTHFSASTRRATRKRMLRHLMWALLRTPKDSGSLLLVMLEIRIQVKNWFIFFLNMVILRWRLSNFFAFIRRWSNEDQAVKQGATAGSNSNTGRCISAMGLYGHLLNQWHKLPPRRMVIYLFAKKSL